jgi:hypothetical protein
LIDNKSLPTHPLFLLYLRYNKIHTDGGKKFVNKLLAELCEMLNVQHSKTAHYHPQCNSQVEVFNKMVKKYLASYVDEITLNWDKFLPALMLAYNTSYHSTIATTPFELLFGMRPRLPSPPAPEIQSQHYGESFPAERLQLLQHARQIAHKTAEQQGLKYRANFDQHASPHKFKVDQKVWLSDTTALGKNPKLTPKWLGPYKIIDLNENNAKIEIKPNKFKIINISKLKAFQEKNQHVFSRQFTPSSRRSKSLSRLTPRFTSKANDQGPKKAH